MRHDEGDRSLATVFADIARAMQAETDPHRTRERVTRTAVDTVDGCDHASISLVERRGGITTVAATDDVPIRVDAIQYEVDEGPCVGAMKDHVIYLIDDLATERRWPRFSHRAARETGVASMLSFRLFVEDDTIGALNLFSRSVSSFTEHDRDVGAVLAAHAALAMAAARQYERAEQLDAALASSRRIGIAIGVLMARRGVTEERAFDLLRRRSQHANVKLRDVAETVVVTGELPDPRTALRDPHA